MTLTATQKARRRAEGAPQRLIHDTRLGAEAPSREAYPSPAHAVQVWLAGDHICVALPPADLGASRGHMVRIPLRHCVIEREPGGATKSAHRGWESLLGILSERAHLRANPRAGVKATPTQYDIDAIMRALAQRAAPREINPEDLGL